MNKKKSAKGAVFFALILAIFFFLQDLQTHHVLTIKDILASVVIAIFSAFIGTFAGIGVMKLMMKSRWGNRSAILHPEMGEIILFQTPANHFKGIEAVGGQLYLTNRRLTFKSNKLNFQNHQLSIRLPETQKVARYTRLLNKNCLLITSTSNANEKFVVENANEWVTALTNRL
jgi:hypothetical protein